MFVLERFYVLSVCPFLGGDFLYLHQADLLGTTSHVWIEAALAPDHRFDQRRVHPVALGGAANRPVLASFQTSFPPPVYSQTACQQQEQKPRDSTKLHGSFLQNMKAGV